MDRGGNVRQARGAGIASGSRLCTIFNICTNSDGLICKGFYCANVMIEMENGKWSSATLVFQPMVKHSTQHATLTAAGAERVFAEKISGVVTDRKALAKAIAALGQGDLLLVTRLDRLARSTRDLLNVLDSVTKVGAGTGRWPMLGLTRQLHMGGWCWRFLAAWLSLSESWSRPGLTKVG
jgi:hypothetical protein